MSGAEEPSAAQLRDLSERIHDTERKAKGVALWEVVQDLVGTELDNRFYAAVSLDAQNGLKLVLQAESSMEAARRVVYRLGLLVNGRRVEATITVPMEVAVAEGRHAMMDSLTDSLARQIAGLLLVDFKLAGIPRS